MVGRQEKFRRGKEGFVEVKYGFSNKFVPRGHRDFFLESRMEHTKKKRKLMSVGGDKVVGNNLDF